MGSKKNKKNKKGDNNLITDPRFASVHWDPRFKNAPKHKAKVEIDDRFKVMFTDPRFRSSSAPSDKRGKLKKITDPGEELRHYYQTNEDEDEVKYDKVDEDEEEDEDEDELSEESESGREEKAKLKEESESETEEEDEKAKVAVEGSESEEMEAGNESETTTDMDTDEDEEDEVVFEDGMPAMQNENIPQIEKETHRLAVVDLDWTHVKAVDLFVVLRSFLPKGGEIKSVAVYPSDFGIERMKQEEIHGPVLFDDKDKKPDEESDDDDEDLELVNQKWRAYEKSRLRYYYAVVECDSVATADYLYRNCDGVEFERSSNILDLRFIPDSLEIKHPPRDTATEVPSNYVGLDFQTRALQQSNIEPSWDDDEPSRRILKRKFSQVDELEMDEFITSDESETDEDEGGDDVNDDKANKKSKKRAQYISLIQSGDGDGSDEDDEQDGQDMEVTFNTGLEDFNKRILEKKDRKSETVWEASLRKRREKKKMKRNKSNYSSEDETSDSDQEAKEEPDDFFIEEPSVKKSKKESRGKSNKEEKQRLDVDKEAASLNELELLLADDKGADKGAKGYNLKRKKAKGKKGKEDPEENKIPTADLDDPRFAPLLTSSLFALDPTNPQFKRSATYERQAALRQHQGDREEVTEREVKIQSEGLSSKIKKSSLINSIKMKARPFEKKEEILPFPGRKETKGEQDSATVVQPVKKKATKVGRK